jgi:hypothetical protein
MFLQRTFHKWRQSVCALAWDFLQEQDFTGSNLIRTDHVGKKPVLRGSSVALEVRRSTPLLTANHAGAASARNAPRRGAPPGSRSTLEQIPVREILLLEEIPG